MQGVLRWKAKSYSIKKVTYMPIGSTEWKVAYSIHFDGRTLPKYNGQMMAFKTKQAAKNKVLRVIASRNRRNKWYAIWTAAYKNVPSREANPVRLMEKIHDIGSVSIGDFIVGRAKRKMKIRDGHVIERLKEYGNPYHYGKYAGLARLLGYRVTSRLTGQSKPHGLRVYYAVNNGEVPRDLDKRKLLVRLSKPSGRALAIKILTEQGIINRYKI